MQVPRHPWDFPGDCAPLTPDCWGSGQDTGISCLASLLPTPGREALLLPPPTRPGAFHTAQAYYF